MSAAEITKKDLKNYAKSSSFLMALLFTFLCGCTALVLGYFINYFAEGHFIHSTDNVIDAKIEMISLMPEETALNINGDSLIVEFSEQNRPEYLTKDITTLKEGIVLFDHPIHGQRMAGKIISQENSLNMLVATNISETLRDFHFMQMLAIVSFIFVFLVVLVSYLISVFVVQGTNRIANTARDIIKTGDLSQRLDVPNTWDDLSSMANTLNLLFDRIEDLMLGVRRVSDNIAHDLRTPLTRMRNHIEDLKKDDTDPVVAYNALIKEADHILGTFNALLRISRIETEQRKNQFTDLDLKALLEDVIEFYEPLAQDKGITIKSDVQKASLLGDRDQLFQAFANQMDNAVKFTPQGGAVDVSLFHKNNNIEIRISDSGPGIMLGEEEKIFARFFRSEESRTTPGTGLGLALVAAIIALHGGTIYAHNTDDGAVFVTIF